MGILQTGGDKSCQKYCNDDNVIKLLRILQDETAYRWIAYPLDALRSSQDGFQPVGQHHDPDDLPEAQGDDCKVITTQPQDRQTQDHSGCDRHYQGDWRCQPEADVQKSYRFRGG